MKSKRAMSAIPFSNTVGDSLDLMKKMWGMAGLPGIPTAGNLASMAVRLPQQLPSMLAPTLDVNELERRINDLRAVEQWLELNASMLRTTIQSLEVQRATISTLKGISGVVLSPMSYMNGGNTWRRRLRPARLRWASPPCASRNRPRSSGASALRRNARRPHIHRPWPTRR
jgi:hypothetical protein